MKVSFKMKNLKEQVVNECLKIELTRMYHNATLKNKLFCESDFESDLFYREFQFQVELAFEDIKHETPNILNYGPVYQYGRGGRTVAPESLINRRGGGSFSIKNVEQLENENFDLEQLLKDLKEFNDFVIQWCKITPDNILLDIRNEFKDLLKKNKNKKRVIRTITEYK